MPESYQKTGSRSASKTKATDVMSAGVRVIIKRAMRSADIPPETANEYGHGQLLSWARHNPRPIAASLKRHYEAAGRCYERSTDSSYGPDEALRQSAAYERKLEQAATLLEPWGIVVDYPGIYPTFEFGDRSYHFAELRPLLDDALATHAVLIDGREKYRSTEPECFGWVLRNQSQSVSYATKHGGYEIREIKGGAA